MSEELTAELNSLNQFKLDTGNRKIQSALNSEYWKFVEELVKKKCLDGKAEVLDFTPEEKLIIDLGFINEEIINTEKVDLDKIKVSFLKPHAENSGYHFSDWLNVQFDKILKKPDKEKLKFALGKVDATLINLQDLIHELEVERERVFEYSYKITLEEQKHYTLEKYKKIVSDFKVYKELDKELLKIESTKRLVENGKFMTPDEKREFIARQQKFDRNKNRLNEKIQEVTNDNSRGHLKELTEKIEDTTTQITKLKLRRERVDDQMAELVKEIEALTGIEIENAIVKVLNFHRDMVKLCANRKRAEAMSVLYGENDPLTLQEVSDIVDFVVEYDPRLFKNERININGIPPVLIVPGYGNGMYDWKYNSFLIPSLPYREKLVSVLSAIVEYKLDCDEDKILMHSYNKLKDYAGVRSSFALKDKFSKDYTTFMKQEARGYKVLPKDIRDWFNRYVAPKKREIKFPIEVDPLLLSKEEYKQLKESTEKKIKDDKGTPRDFFVMGTIQHYYDEDRDALNSFIRSVKLDNNDLKSIFNAGIIAMKLKEKDLAIKFFSHHMKVEPQGWWSNVCRDHILELQK